MSDGRCPGSLAHQPVGAPHRRTINRMHGARWSRMNRTAATNQKQTRRENGNIRAPTYRTFVRDMWRSSSAPVPCLPLPSLPMLGSNAGVSVLRVRVRVLTPTAPKHHASRSTGPERVAAAAADHPCSPRPWLGSDGHAGPAAGS